MTNILQTTSNNFETIQNTYPTKLLNNVNNSAPLVNDALTQTQKAFLILYKKENICDFYDNMYKNFDTSTQMLFHMEFFVTLFEKYRTLLKQKNDECLPLVSVEEYKKMPKIYRGAFKMYDENHYVLNTHTPFPRTFLSINKTNQIKTKLLFNQIADLLLSFAFGPKKFEIENINKLYSIFEEIDKNISSHKNRIVVNNYKNDPIQNRHGAWDIYTEYQNELTHKDFYAIPQNKINEAKKIKRMALSPMSKDMKKCPTKISKKTNASIIAEYKRTYRNIILDIKEKVLKEMSTPKII